MFNNLKLNSLYVKLNIIIFSLITLATITLSVYHVIKVKNTVEYQAQEQSKTAFFKLKDSIVPFIDSYEITEYEKIIKNNIIHSPFIRAIVLKDYKTGKIFGLENYLTGYIKTNNQSIEILNDKNIKNHALFSKLKESYSSNIYDLKSHKIAYLEIYISNEFIMENLKKDLIDSLLILLVFYIILIFISYFLIKKYFSNPLENIVQTLRENKDNIFSMVKLNEHSSTEFSFLSESFNLLIEDITKAQKELKQSQLKWQFAIEGSGDGLWDWNIKTNEVYFSNQWKMMLGYEIDEISNHLSEWEKRVHPDDLMKAYNDINAYLEGKIPIYQNEHRMRCKDGSYIWILAKGIATERDKSNIPTKLIGTHSNITQRKNFEINMKEASIVFNNSSDGILITDNNKNILNANKAFEEITGFSRKDVIGKQPSILKSDKNPITIYRDMWTEIQKNSSWTGNIIDKKKNGEFIDLIVTINAIKQDDETQYYVAIFHDITIYKKQERIIFQQSRTAALGEMIGNIAHQWRQPLSIISTVSTGLKFMIEYNDNINKKEAIEQLSKINNYVQYLSDTIDDFRNFFRNESTSFTKVNLKETLNKVITLTKDSLENNFIKYEEKIDDIAIFTYENLIIQCFINIINNAVDKFKETKNIKEKIVFIEAKKENNKIIITITDTAGGIDEEVIDKIFDPYFTTKHESIGTGIGLFMTYEIISKHLKGRITASNETTIIDNESYTGASFRIEIDSNETQQ